MARGVNKVIIVGNAGSDAEVRFMPSGGAVANVSIATTKSWKDKQSGQMQERTEWHKLVFMDRGNFQLGKIAGDYIKKGSKIYIEGSLRTNEWEKDGVKRYTTEIVVNELQLLDSLPEGQQQNKPQQQPAPQVAQHQSWGDPWIGLKPAGQAAHLTIDQIKADPSIQGNAQAALNFGWVVK